MTTALFEEFQEFRKILCVCPCCGEIVRVSDLRLRAKGPPVRTWLDNYEQQNAALDRKEEKFEDREETLREIAKDKGRREAKKVFNEAISLGFRELKLDPFDVKPILHPVDFLVFKGMNTKEKISDIIFLSKHYTNPLLSSIREQVKKVVQKRNYEWQVARIDEKGNIVFE